MAAERARRIADALLRARRTRQEVIASELDGPVDLDEAYQVQDLVLQALPGAAHRCAWKVSPPRPGAEPVASPVPESCLLDSPAVVRASEYPLLGIEVEIAFRFGLDLPPRQPPFDPEGIADAVSEVLVLIELVDTRLANWTETSTLWKLADFQSNGALVLGSGAREWRAIDFSAQRVELEVDGVTRARVTGTHPVGNPLQLLPWLAGHCARRCGGLRAGSIVTTGSWTGMEFVSPGTNVVARFPRLGEASLRIER